MGVCGGNNEVLQFYSDQLFMGRQLLVGFDCWNCDKAQEEGFWSYVQRYTGVLFDFDDATASFDSKRCVKLKNLLKQVITIDLNKHIPLQLVETIVGVVTWLVRVLKPWQPLVSGFSRCLQGVSSSAPPDTPTSPAYKEPYARGTGDGAATLRHHNRHH